MKKTKIKLNKKEYSRFFNYVKEMMTIVKPFVFRGEDSKVYCINHGLQDGTLAGGYKLADIRRYAETHSNITSDEMLNLIACYGGVIKEKHPSVRVSINESIYPVLIGADRELSDNIDGGYAIFGVPENDTDIETLVAELNNNGIRVNAAELKATTGY